MKKRNSPLTASSFASINSFEMLLAFFLLAFGGIMVCLGWDRPRLIGYVPNGTIQIIGGAVCAWLTWKRRGTQRSTLLPLMLVIIFPGLVEGILKWQAKKENAGWPMTSCILVVFILALTIAEAIHHQKQAAIDAVRESTLLDKEDGVKPAEALALAQCEAGNADKFALTSMMLMLLAGALGLLSLTLQAEPQDFWLRLLTSLGFLATGFFHWKVRRKLNQMRASLQNLDYP